MSSNKQLEKRLAAKSDEESSSRAFFQDKGKKSRMSKKQKSLRECNILIKIKESAGEQAVLFDCHRTGITSFSFDFLQLCHT